MTASVFLQYFIANGSVDMNFITYFQINISITGNSGLLTFSCKNSGIYKNHKSRFCS